jgi:Zn-dependent peptidase ImmA (M78 family)
MVSQRGISQIHGRARTRALLLRQHIFSEGKVRHQSDSGFTSEDRYEREADTFAAGLLMPERLFEDACLRTKPGLEIVERLAESCGTSLTATGIRYALLSPDPITVICSKGDRVQFAFMSQTLKARRGLTWIKKNMGLPKGTATATFNKDPSNVTQARRITSTRGSTVGAASKSSKKLLVSVIMVEH